MTNFNKACRVSVLFAAVIIISNTSKSSTMYTTGPYWDKSYQAFQRGLGSYTAGWAPSVTVDFGTYDNNDKFKSILNEPYDAEMFLSDQQIYSYASDNKRYSGAADTLYVCKSILWEMQMGPKVDRAYDEASFTMKKGTEKTP